MSLRDFREAYKLMQQIEEAEASKVGWETKIKELKATCTHPEFARDKLKDLDHNDWYQCQICGADCE